MHDILLTKTDYPAVALLFPSNIPIVHVNPQIEGNRSLGAIWNDALLYINLTSPI